MSAARKYDTHIQITSEYLDKFSIMNTNKQNDYARSKTLKQFGGCKYAISQNYCDVASFFMT